jgi:hypothetical protein
MAETCSTHDGDEKRTEHSSLETRRNETDITTNDIGIFCTLSLLPINFTGKHHMPPSAIFHH